MAKLIESAIKIVTINKRKWLIRLSQKAIRTSELAMHSVHAVGQSFGQEQAPNPS